MNFIPDRPLDPPEVQDIEIPDGLTVIRELPNKVANDIIADHIHESAGNGKSHLQHIFDTAFLTEGAFQRKDIVDYEVNLRKLLFAVIGCATQAGESDHATDEYIRNEEWVRGL